MPEETELQYKVPLMQQQMEELETHGTYAHNAGGGGGRVDRVPVIVDAPKLQLGVDCQTWDVFLTRWGIFKTAMGLDGATAPSWLFHCLDKE